MHSLYAFNPLCLVYSVQILVIAQISMVMFIKKLVEIF